MLSSGRADSRVGHPRYFVDTYVEKDATSDWIAGRGGGDLGFRPSWAEGSVRDGQRLSPSGLKGLKEQQARFAPRERRLEQIDRAEKLLAEIDVEKKYPWEYLVFRITGFRPDNAPALIARRAGRPARPAAVRRRPVGDGEPEGRAGERAGADGRGGGQAVQRLDPDRHALATPGAGGAPVRHRRPHEGRVPGVERPPVRRRAPRAGGARARGSSSSPTPSARRSSAAPAGWPRSAGRAA